MLDENEMNKATEKLAEKVTVKSNQVAIDLEVMNTGIQDRGDSREKARSSRTGKESKLPEGLVILDGATGTELDRRGVDCGLPLWSARAMTEAPDVLKDVHKAYLTAGAQAIITNTFRTHQRSLEKANMGD